MLLFFFFYPLPFSFFFYVTSILSAIHVLSFFLSRIKWSFVRTAAPCGSCLIDRKPVTASTLARIKRHLRDQSSSIFRRVGIVSRKATPPRIHKILFLLSSLILFVHLSVTNRWNVVHVTLLLYSYVYVSRSTNVYTQKHSPLYFLFFHFFSFYPKKKKKERNTEATYGLDEGPRDEDNVPSHQ